uniref:Uncharacterized protein n=1 Tax=Anguilla anguilla TaxID=7936 RepID=A0A0E9XMV9_ANGAN
MLPAYSCPDLIWANPGSCGVWKAFSGLDLREVQRNIRGESA